MLLHRRHRLFGNINDGGYSNQPIVWLRLIETVDVAIEMHEAIRRRIKEAEERARQNTR